MMRPSGATETTVHPAPPPPLRSDELTQVRLHRPVRQARAQVIRALLATAEYEDLPKDGRGGPAARLARTLTTCGRYPVLIQHKASGRLVTQHARCNQRACPTCRPIRAKQLEARVRNAVRRIDDARLLTLTLRSDDRPLADQISHLKESWTRLRRTKQFRTHVHGGVSVLEITYNIRTDQWHPHLHVVIDGRYWAQASIADAWETASRGSRIVDIRRVPSREALTKYVTKYLSKTAQSPNMPDRRVSELALALKGQRLAQPFGNLHGHLKDPDAEDAPSGYDDVCPVLPLIQAAANGDSRAIRLQQALRRLPRCRTSDAASPEAAAALRRHRSIALRLRHWWRSKQEALHHAHDPPKRPRRRQHNPHQRSLWERQIDELTGRNALAR